MRCCYPDRWPLDPNPIIYCRYFVCRDVSCDKQVVGVAVADTPEGPFKPLGEAPFIAQVNKSIACARRQAGIHGLVGSCWGVVSR